MLQMLAPMVMTISPGPGTVKTSVVSSNTLVLAGIPPTYTLAPWLKPEPVHVTWVPTGPLVGLHETQVGLVGPGVGEGVGVGVGVGVGHFQAGLQLREPSE